ncbi:MAG: hypothetical protein RL535_1402 [Pseudomonadota bacterium]
MAGLLDFFGNGWEDPKSSAVMAFANGLLNKDFAGGMQGYTQAMAGAKDAQFKRAMQQAQMDNLASEIEARKLAGVKDARQQEMLKPLIDRFKNQGMQAAFPTGGMSTPMGAINAQQGNIPMPANPMQPTGSGSSVMGSLTPDDIALMKVSGIDLTDIYKWSHDPQKLEQGNIYKDRNTGVERFMPKVGEGMMPNQEGVYGFAPGYAEAQAKFEGDKTRAVEKAKAGYSLQEKTLAGGQPVIGTTSQLLEAVQGSNPFMGTPPMGGQPRPAAAGSEANSIAAAMGGLGGLPTTARGGNISMKSTPAEMDKPLILRDAFNEASARWEAANKIGDSANMNRAKADIEDIRSEFAKLGGARPQSLAPQAPNTAPSLGLQLQSQQEKDALKTSSENVGKVNDVWLKSSYTPLIESKGATTAKLDSINQSRAAIESMGGTGWGTEAKATAANVLTGLGIGGKNAEMFASNAQKFQQAAMTQLQAGLSVQKGVQTKEDAQRQADTYAALKNTTQANAYILDSTQAMAERDLMKAQFYELALPVASKKGDLQEIDREWNKKMPSLFSMPSMQKWAKK